MRKCFHSSWTSVKLREQRSTSRSKNPAACGARGCLSADSRKLSGTLVTEPVFRLTRVSPSANDSQSSASLPTKVSGPTKLFETKAPDSIKEPSSTILIGPTVAPGPTYTFLPSQQGAYNSRETQNASHNW